MGLFSLGSAGVNMPSLELVKCSACLQCLGDCVSAMNQSTFQGCLTFLIPTFLVVFSFRRVALLLSILAA